MQLPATFGIYNSKNELPLYTLHVVVSMMTESLFRRVTNAGNPTFVKESSTPPMTRASAFLCARTTAKQNKMHTTSIVRNDNSFFIGLYSSTKAKSDKNSNIMLFIKVSKGVKWIKFPKQLQSPIGPKLVGKNKFIPVTNEKTPKVNERSINDVLLNLLQSPTTPKSSS